MLRWIDPVDLAEIERMELLVPLQRYALRCSPTRWGLLFSDNGASVNGRTILVDGGAHLT